MADLVRKILVFRLGAMGDILFTTPALRGLRRAYPKAEITYVTLRKWVYLVRHNPCVNRVVGLSRVSADAVGALGNERFDLLINLFEGEVGARICEALQARERRGDRWIDGKLVSDENSRWLGQDQETQRELSRRNITLAEVHCAIAGVQPNSLRFDFVPGVWASFRARALGFLCGFCRDCAPIALHLHSRGYESKCWSAEHALQVVRRMRDRRFLVLGYHPDREKTRFLEREPNVTVTYADSEVQGALLRRCALFVGIDSGPRQLASAAGIPVLSLLGARPCSFIPRNENEFVICVKEPCVPCFEGVCPRGLDCLSQIGVEEIVGRIEGILGRGREQDRGL